jgi:hypothetical protein
MRRDGKGQVYNNLQLLSQVLPRLKAFMITRHKMLQFDELFKQETGKDRYRALLHFLVNTTKRKYVSLFFSFKSEHLPRNWPVC